MSSSTLNPLLGSGGLGYLLLLLFRLWFLFCHVISSTNCFPNSNQLLCYFVTTQFSRNVIKEKWNNPKSSVSQVPRHKKNLNGPLYLTPDTCIITLGVYWTTTSRTIIYNLCRTFSMKLCDNLLIEAEIFYHFRGIIFCNAKRLQFNGN